MSTEAFSFVCASINEEGLHWLEVGLFDWFLLLSSGKIKTRFG